VNKIIATTNKENFDIDGLSSALALGDLLKMENKEVEVVLEGKPDHSVTESLKNEEFRYTEKFSEPNENVDFAIVDTSNPVRFPHFVDIGKVVELYDHRAGFEKIWKNRIGKKARIEKVGACATLIWEEYKKRGFAKKITSLNAGLMAAAIVSNTLNFRASITTERDRTAFRDLKSFAGFENDWIEKYFTERESAIYKNIEAAIKGDAFVQEIPNSGIRIAIGQMELWRGKDFIKGHEKEIIKAMSSFKTSDWFFTLPSISEGKNYLYAGSKEIEAMLENTLGIKFADRFGSTSRLWLRKEMLEKILSPRQSGERSPG
jgi:inorganic pyrophosphatase/exopolyphosphatase